LEQVAEQEEKKPRDRWLSYLERHKSGNTSKSYIRYFDRLVEAMESTPENLLAEVEANVNKAWLHAKEVAEEAFTLKGEVIALMAVKSFMRANGIYNLPQDRIEGSGKRIKPAVPLSWENAERIYGAASRPYNIIFKLMLHCGWGIGEFMEFNTAENWDAMRTAYTKKPEAEYYRFDFGHGRKSGEQPHYTLIPGPILREVLSSGITLPFVTESGYPFDMQHYWAASTYLGRAFRTAKRRALVSAKIQDGKVSPHDLRSAFRTQGTAVHSDPTAVEFAMFHEIDEKNYNRIYGDEVWQWEELRKIYGGRAITETELQSRDTRIEELQKAKITLEKKVADQSAMLGIILKRLEGIAGEHGVEVPEAGPVRKKARK
jgi:integrase